MPPKPRISRSQALALLRQGKKPSEIAEIMNESKQAINYVLHHQGTDEVKTPLRVAQESVPWKNVAPEHKKAATWARIINHAEYMATGGRGMSPRKLEMLRNWYRNLERLDAVVEYDPSIPPAPNAKHGGWGYVPREERDGALLLRVNEYVTMSDAAYELWRIPEKRPGA